MEPYFGWIEDGEFFFQMFTDYLASYALNTMYISLSMKTFVLWKESRKIALDISRNELWTTETKLYI